MTDTDKPTETQPHISIASIGGYGLSTDGTSAVVAMRATDGESQREFSIIMPAAMIAELLTVAKSLWELAAKAGIKKGQAAIKDPIGYAVGSHPHMPGATMIIFNQNTINEEMFRFTDEDALNFADAIRKDIGGRRAKQLELDRLAGRKTIFKGRVQ